MTDTNSIMVIAREFMPRDERDAFVADAARRHALLEVSNWLDRKVWDAENYPGGREAHHMEGRAAAYKNAAQHVRRMAESK